MDDLSFWSLDWFTFSTLGSYTWANPLFLYGIALVPLLLAARWLWRYYFNQKLPVAVTKSEIKSSPIALLRLVPRFCSG